MENNNMRVRIIIDGRPIVYGSRRNMENNNMRDRIQVDYDTLENMKVQLLSLLKELEDRKPSFGFDASMGDLTECLYKFSEALQGIGMEFHTLVERTYNVASVIIDEFVDVEKTLSN